MKKIIISIIAFIFLSVCCINPAYAKEEGELPLGIDIDGDVTLGNTNANLSLGGYMAPLKDAKNYEYSFYAYYNPPFYFLGGASDLRNEDKQGLIKYTREDIDDITSDTSVDVLSYGFDCKNINNYNDEWIFFMKNNDGCIYKAKADGTKETKLELPFFVKRFLLVNDRLIIETQFCEYGKILSTDLNGDDLRLIAKCDPRCGDMMIQADENGVYYYDDVNLEIKRISYDGKEETLIHKGRDIDGAPVLSFQVSNNKIIIKLYDKYNYIRTIILNLDMSLENIQDIEPYIERDTHYDIGVPLFEYESLLFPVDSYNFSEAGFFILSSIMPENHILGYDKLDHLPHRFFIYNINLNDIENLSNQMPYNRWDDEVFYSGYIDLIGGTDYEYSLYVLSDEIYLYDPIKYLNIISPQIYPDSHLSYKEPNYDKAN